MHPGTRSQNNLFRKQKMGMTVCNMYVKVTPCSLVLHQKRYDDTINTDVKGLKDFWNSQGTDTSRDVWLFASGASAASAGWQELSLLFCAERTGIGTLFDGLSLRTCLHSVVTGVANQTSRGIAPAGARVCIFHVSTHAASCHDWCRPFLQQKKKTWLARDDVPYTVLTSLSLVTGEEGGTQRMNARITLLLSVRWAFEVN